MINLQKTEKTVRLYVEKLILPSEPLYPLWNNENRIFSKGGKWNYIDACMIKSTGMLYEIYGDERLLNYAVRFTDSYVREDGTIPSMNPLDYNLDNINGAKNLIYLFKKTGREKYRRAFELIYSSQLLSQPRLNCGSFFHKAIYPYQIWLDGTYMVLPFLAEYADFSGDTRIYADIENQIENIIRIMRDEKSGLYKHGYDESRTMHWADSQTGLSGEFWLRAMGWFYAALADLCGLAENVPTLYDTCRRTLDELLHALSKCIYTDNMLYQLPSKPEIRGNYPETSGTLLFSYAALKAYRLGICDEKIKADGVRALSAVTESFIELRGNEIPIMKNICLVAGLGGKTRHSGTAEYYLGKPTMENDAKGIAPYLMAFTELKRLSLNEGDGSSKLSPEAAAYEQQKNHV